MADRKFLVAMGIVALGMAWMPVAVVLTLFGSFPDWMMTWAGCGTLLSMAGVVYVAALAVREMLSEREGRDG